MSNTNQQGSQPNSSTPQFASIEINDAVVKFSLYLEKLTYYEQSLIPQNQPKCHKLIRLILQAFIKYAQTQDFSKQSYDLVKSSIIMKKSYYSLIVMDLMMKNNKFIIKQVKKQLEPMMKLIWEKVNTQTNPNLKESKLENLKVIIKCWGFIFGDKIQENLRKWLQTKYNIKRIDLNEQNQKALRQTYGDKMGKDNVKSTNDKQPKLSEALLNSLIDDDNLMANNSIYISNANVQSVLASTTHNLYQQSRESMVSSDPRMYRYHNSTSQIPIMTNNQLTKNAASNEFARSLYPLNLPNNGSQPQTTKPKSLEGMNKSLLEALDLN